MASRETKTMNMSVIEVLMSIRDGGAIEEIATELRTVVAAVQMTGKAGKLTLTIDVKKNGDSKVTIKDTIKTVLPQPEKGEEIFFVTKELGLTRDNPAQLTLDQLKEVQ